MSAIAEYRRKETDYLEKVKALDDVTDRRNTARKAWDELRRLRLESFMEGFGQITLKLKEMYQMITLGGDAEVSRGRALVAKRRSAANIAVLVPASSASLTQF